ncbi:MAG: ATP-binding protein [Chitinispirillia bacterium]|nr:ATP-binding protein [Chitinispirillia bacterium]MCL2241302.1 ATP-binding protein [Chitinispirillia bacterium]
MANVNGWNLSTVFARRESVSSFIVTAVLSLFLYVNANADTGGETGRRTPQNSIDTASQFYAELTGEEREYIKTRPVVHFGAEFDNYPISFYDRRHKQWHGLTHDILREVETLTGITFKRTNEGLTPFSTLLKQLESGSISVVSELIRSAPREGRFLWPEIPVLTDRYILVTKMDRPNITANEIGSLKIGVQKGAAYDEMFNIWFPNHKNAVYYESLEELYDALERGKVDAAMASFHILLSVTNYLERPGYRANLVFDYKFESHIGFNVNERVLCSVVEKAMRHTDLKKISDTWMHKTYDYRAKLAESQRPWVIGAFALLVCVIALLLILIKRTLNEEKRLETVVRQRTTELKILGRDLENAYSSASAANRAKSVFLANVSHEIRTPMNTIIGMSEIVLRGNIPPETRQQISAIKQSGTNLLTIMNDILDISKIENGKLELAPVHYCLRSLIKDIAAVIRERLAGLPVEFTEEADENIPDALLGDETRIRQILMNVLGNAVKFTAKGFVSLSVKATGAGNGVTALTFKIADSGRGIRRHDIGRLFDSFVQTDLVNNKGIEGMGLGLAITWNLIKAMDGDITVESEFGKGSTFTITLPQKTGDRQKLAAKRTGAMFTAPEARVLIVDDIATNLKVAEGLLAPYKMQIDTCLSGAEAIELVKANTYDLVFMDHMMPIMDGIEAVKNIRELDGGRGEKLPVAALTANAVSGMREMFLQNGFNGFIPKPIDTIALNALLEELIPAEKRKELTGDELKALTEETSSGDDEDIMIKGVNIKKGIAVMGGKLESYLQTLDVFRKDGRDKLNAIKEVLAQNNMQLYTIYVHALKSAAANIGAAKLSESARDLETAANKGDRAFIDAHNPEMTAELGAVLTGIDSCLKAINAKTRREGTGGGGASGMTDINAANAELRKLKNAIDIMNASAMNEAVKNLQRYTGDENFGEALDKILQNALIGEYDEAVGLIDKVLGGNV